MATKAAVVRNQVESALGSRVPAPFTFRGHRVFEMIPSGVPEIDALTAPLSYDPAAETSSGRSLLQPAVSATRETRGIAEGGLPRGALTEIVGPSSSGRTSLMISLMAEMTVREEV